ncbi:MAG: DUF3048 domain-containing protein [bacterium]|nr:DUF3048 domain-containing protein [bacterium]
MHTFIPRAFVLFALFVVVAVAPAAAQAPNAPNAVIGPLSYPESVNPLTGLPVADPGVLNRRPIIVKISNYPPFVRPQSGLMAADIVWEHLLSGGVTRFSAVFYAQDAAVVGPIRSLRLVDFELVRIYRALSVYSGMAQGTLDVLRTDAVMSSRIVGGVEPCPALCRYPREGVALEHTLFGDTAALRQLAADRGRDTTPENGYGMAFSTDVSGDYSVDAIRILWAETAVEWTYDPASERWFRAQDGAPHHDAATGEPISAANVVIIEADHTVQPYISDNYWGPGDFAFSVNFVGSGRAYLFRDGLYFAGQWNRASRTDPLTYTDASGEPMLFTPGNTFFALVPRWVDGYSLLFDSPLAPTAAVTGTTGVSMRLGPGEEYITPDVAYPGDRFRLVGRNNRGDWLQTLALDGRIVWLPRAVLDVNDQAVAQLPATRPTIER